MLAVVVLLQFIQNSSHDIYSSFSGNLDYSWNRELQHICGDRFLPAICSATLISRRHALTAAHCVTTFTERRKKPGDKCSHKLIPESYIRVYPPTRVTNILRLEPFTSSFRVVKVTVHPNFDPCNKTGDVALLEISPNMFSDGAPICMPDANETIPKSLRAAGFGRNPKFHGKRYLQVVNLTLLLNYSEEIVTCSPGYTICAGDSGGPLFKTNETRYTLLGVASRGVKCEKDEDENVSFFEDVRPKLEWICKNSGICPMGFSTKPKAG
ncbi:trypsin [Dictyocaulus viviparus]|uniref:Trypsin n=1 Tax=Dictyocaulus viviparus TaxID=29172 RepID=A0A0D8Y4K9_DICVI|nr:trypsin [Dictyocaulus viviparus]